MELCLSCSASASFSVHLLRWIVEDTDLEGVHGERFPMEMHIRIFIPIQIHDICDRMIIFSLSEPFQTSTEILLV